MSPKTSVAKAILVSNPACETADFYPLSDDCLKGQYVTKQVLERVRSYETNGFRFNRALSDEYMGRLDPNLKLPVLMAFVHKQFCGPYESVIRLVITMPKHGRMPTRASDLTQATVDLPIDDFLSLPTISDDPRSNGRPSPMRNG